MAISKQWINVDLANNQFSNTCQNDVQYLGLCNQASVNTDSSGLSGGAIFGIVVAAVVGVALIALVVWVIVRKARGGRISMPRMPSMPSSKAAAFERFEDSASGPSNAPGGASIHAVAEGAGIPTSEGAAVHDASAPR